jgi:hypothetical protein
MSLRLSFPNPVNEVAARVVAAGVVVECLAFLVFRSPLVLVALAYGFIARVLAGPRFSPLALLATRVIVPRMPVPPRWVPGPPKRFAQGIGATLSVGALTAWLVQLQAVAMLSVAAITVAATLESAFALCVGCKLFAGLMRVGVIPPSVCAACQRLPA